MLSLEEKHRNRKSSDCCSWFCYDATCSVDFSPTLPDIPALIGTKVSGITVVLPEVENNFTLCAGVKLGQHAPSHFPTLRTLPFASKHEYAHLTLTRMASEKETLVISLESPAHPSADLVFKAAELMGKVVYSRWPYHEESKVVEVCSEMWRIRGDQAFPCEIEWQKVTSMLTNKYLKSTGIRVGRIEVLVRVEPIIGMKSTAEGEFSKIFNSHAAYWIPYQTVVTEIENLDPKFQERKNQIEETFPKNSAVVITTGEFLGGVGEVLDYKEASLCNVRFVPLAKLPNFPRVAHSRWKEPSIPFDSLATELQVSKKTIAQITGMVRVKDANLDIGLNMKNNSKNEKVVGLCLLVGRNWHFTTAGASLLRGYHFLFPQVFSAIAKSKNAFNLVTKDVFPLDTDERMGQLRKWIKSLLLWPP